MTIWVVKELRADGFVYARAWKKGLLVERVRTQKEATKFTSYETAIEARRAMINATNFSAEGPWETAERKDNIRVLRLVT